MGVVNESFLKQNYEAMCVFICEWMLRTQCQQAELQKEIIELRVFGKRGKWKINQKNWNLNF